MSFRCQFCDRAMPSRAKPIKIITKKRDAVYQEIRDGKKIIDAGGSGWEIAKELDACKKCAIERGVIQKT